LTAICSYFSSLSGYIGGSVLDRLLAHPSFKSFRITVLIRAPEKAAALESVGITPVVGTYQDLALLEKLASDADYAVTVVSAALSESIMTKSQSLTMTQTDCDDVPANAAILKGLKQRHEATGRKPTLIHTVRPSFISTHAHWSLT
jgi:hypothetical protein